MGDGGRLALAFAAFVAAGIAAIGPNAAAVPRTAPAERAPAIQVLNSLPVAPEAASGYRRSLFRHWITQPNGCSTRQDVLIDERRAGVVRGCSVAGGRWLSAYDGQWVTSASALDIDHMVPLLEAWQSGAWRWSEATRRAYANDLGYRYSLVAVTATTNRSKADRDPSDWLPDRDRCTYAGWWISVKYRWRLSVDTSEKRALADVLSSCSLAIDLPPLAPRQVDAASPDDAGSSGGPAESSTVGVTSVPGSDPRFRTCGDANAAGYGPYVRGQDPEYDWYIDRDGDGRACER